MPASYLSQGDVEAISSPYLQQRSRYESWRIRWIRIDGDTLEAAIDMTATHDSPTDPGGFHLTSFSVEEFAAQFMIIYAHHWAGLNRKMREGWMVESAVKAVKVIRRTRDIRVSMRVRRIRKRGENIYCQADYRVTDADGGLFEIMLKGFLS